jgi:glycosyltransferase involved in cell wall biosynthesis
MGRGEAGSEKRKVLLVVRWPVGGIRTFLRYVYRNFDPDRWHFTIIAPEIDELKVLVDDLSGLDIEYRPIEKKPSAMTFLLCIASHLLKNRYDLVHSHGFTSGMCAALPTYLWRIPHLMTSHDVINANQFSGLKGRIKQKGMAVLLRLVNKIHSVSYDAENNLLKYFPELAKRERKCVVIQNGIDVERFLAAEPRDLRGELGLADNTFLIGFMGRFMAQKGFRYLVDAMALLRDEKDLPKRPLVLTFGDGGFIRQEKQTIEERALEDYFHFMPFAPNVAGTIKGVDVVVIPSLWEACPLLPMETFVCGIPVIGSDCIGLREVLQKTPAKLVKSKNSRMLADAIKEEITVSRKNIFVSYIDMAIGRFDVKSQSKELKQIYYSMLKI